ncbi:hypothetical protein IEQ34_019086 [Dendrobium chrysotoxum]|uniref:Uncharacterized protein n=1 Tax=Dendrobium chrysotoxum TaxID=161865 RepID=A0AAV7G8G0_DENCH|nr:hypothetical protein IEQ34_019086 [Dendrobium chrysotoxum]
MKKTERIHRNLDLGLGLSQFNELCALCDYMMSPQDPNMKNGQSASQVAPMQSTTLVIIFDYISQITSLVEQYMDEAQNGISSIRSDNVDLHLQIFFRLKPPRFEGIVEPKVEEDWLIRLEKTFDGIQ